MAALLVVVYHLEHAHVLLCGPGMDEHMWVHLRLLQQLLPIEVIDGAHAPKKGRDEVVVEVEREPIELTQSIQSLQGVFLARPELPIAAAKAGSILLVGMSATALGKERCRTDRKLGLYLFALSMELQELDVVLIALRSKALHLVHYRPWLAHVVELNDIRHLHLVTDDVL